MRILIVPLPALAPTQGSQLRVRQLITGFRAAGFEVATCAAEDLNFKKQEGITNYFLEIPIPMGLPSCIGKNMFQFAAKTGLSSKKTVHSFDEVLFLTGAIHEGYFRRSVQCICGAIETYKPDLVYSEFNLSAIIAAKLEGVKVFTDYSYPVQDTFASKPSLAKGVNRALKAWGMPGVSSVLEIFKWADYQIVPSSYTLEPIDGENIIFTGPFMTQEESRNQEVKRDKILAYMGIGTISNKKLVHELTGVFAGQPYEVYIVGKGLKAQTRQNIHLAPFIDFKELLPETAVFIHHGGQNSIMDALQYGVPQLICPGKMFERKYNAYSITSRGAGITLSEKAFCSKEIKASITKLIKEESYKQNSQKLWQEIKELGGAARIVELIKENKGKYEDKG